MVKYYMIKRELEKRLKYLSRKFPVVAVLGPRQSGKTTLVKYTFPKKRYVSLENIDTREYAMQDPRGFLKEYPDGAIFDEIQRVPELFSYIQTIVDESKGNGKFILTGSNNFLLSQQISQSLAGRIALLTLLPFTVPEIKSHSTMNCDYESYIFKGFYPRLYDENIDPTDLYPDYIRTYVERDVRMIKNITDLRLFQNFMKLCAGRIGQLVNYSSLGNDCGINHKTVKSWLSILKASYIIVELQSFNRNFNKRIVKMPKLYFVDTGLACSLLGIRRADQVKSHFLKGSLFENLVIMEVMKKNVNYGNASQLYFWRDSNGNEVDLLIGELHEQKIVEIKSARTIASDFIKGIRYYQKISGVGPENSFIVYGGDESQSRSLCSVKPWNELSEL